MLRSSKYWPSSMSAISPRCAGLQPRSSCVRVLEVGLSRGTKGERKPKWSPASSGATLTVEVPGVVDDDVELARVLEDGGNRFVGRGLRLNVKLDDS
jgi:hypothetical protein